mmetsp:Transcript_38312/g.81804  ORF Transcript_38312/g.81804 Transcript_38312/m.81804 type:complete len:84 (+) Transcript_38312:281-532(+)
MCGLPEFLASLRETRLHPLGLAIGIRFFMDLVASAPIVLGELQDDVDNGFCFTIDIARFPILVISFLIELDLSKGHLDYCSNG